MNGEVSGRDFCLELFKLERGEEREAGAVAESHPESGWHKGRPIAGFESFNEMVDEGFIFCVERVLYGWLAGTEIWGRAYAYI